MTFITNHLKESHFKNLNVLGDKKSKSPAQKEASKKNLEKARESKHREHFFSASTKHGVAYFHKHSNSHITKEKGGYMAHINHSELNPTHTSFPSLNAAMGHVVRKTAKAGESMHGAPSEKGMKSIFHEERKTGRL